MGLALLHGEVLPGAHFTPNFLKLLLGQPAKLDDLRGNPPLLTFLKQLAAGQFKYAISLLIEYCQSDIKTPVLVRLRGGGQCGFV